MEENEKDFELVSIWRSDYHIHSSWQSRDKSDLVGIVEAIAGFAMENEVFLYLLMGALVDCARGGNLSREISKTSIDISNFNDILKNTDNNG